MSAGAGVVVVALSMVVSRVQGNLLEVAYKVVNLLTAPLFGIFFMAIFVRWATPLGTIAGAAVGVTVVSAINYWRELTGEPPPLVGASTDQRCSIPDRSAIRLNRARSRGSAIRPAAQAT